jgi:hypothetical protein
MKKDIQRSYAEPSRNPLIMIELSVPSAQLMFATHKYSRISTFSLKPGVFYSKGVALA